MEEERSRRRFKARAASGLEKHTGSEVVHLLQASGGLCGESVAPLAPLVSKHSDPAFVFKMNSVTQPVAWLCGVVMLLALCAARAASARTKTN